MAFIAFLKPFASIIFTRESAGNIAADAIEGASARQRANNFGSIVNKSLRPQWSLRDKQKQRDGEERRKRESW